jgi:hypothetical protein
MRILFATVVILLALAFGAQAALPSPGVFADGPNSAGILVGQSIVGPTGGAPGHDAAIGTAGTPLVTAAESGITIQPGIFPLLVGAALLLAPVLLKVRKKR